MEAEAGVVVGSREGEELEGGRIGGGRSTEKVADVLGTMPLRYEGYIRSDLGHEPLFV